jgi:hypothetical protein
VRAERVQVEQGVSPAVAAISAEIADLEVLIESRPARAATLRPLIEDLRERQANLRRAASRKAVSSKAAEIPAEEAYRAAAADMAATLKSSNMEAARVALRALVGSIPIFAEGGKIFGRIGLDLAQPFRSSNPRFIESVGSGGLLRAL